MAGKASPIRIPTPGVYLGKFHVRRFDIAIDSDRKVYEELRTKANESDSGIAIENIRDQVETTENSDVEGNRERVDRWFIIVSWWEKDTKAVAKKPEPSQGFYVERTAGSDTDNTEN